MKLRLLAALLLSVLLVFGAIACTDGNTTEETNAPGSEGPTSEESAIVTEAPSEDDMTDTEAETPTEAPTEAPTEGATEEATEEVTTEEITTEEVTTLRELTWETYDPALDDSKVDTSAEHTVDATQWVATDGLGRLVSTNTTTGDLRDKTVAIFYWTWHGDFANGQTAYNNQQNINKLIDLGYTERDYMTMSMSQLNKLGIKTQMGPYHFWDEPVFGYYDGDDEWVIRKHAEMLAAAGVDVVFFDNTNGAYTWLETALKVMKVFSEARAQGVDAPDVSFMLPFGPTDGARQQLLELYAEIFEKGLYSDVWYELDGKPMLMAWGNVLDKTNARQKEIYDFFTFRYNLGGYLEKETTTNQWGWLSRYPQAFFHNDQGVLEQITVGVAINHNYVKSIIAPMSYGENIIGRTWTSRGYDTRENALLYGACFAEQWENAISVDPEIVFVTAWNEWVAMRIDNWPASPEQYQNCFVDQYNAEYSRDTEPSNGILKDHYYYQLADYIRQFKGTNAIEAASPEKLMDVNGGYGQWADVGPTYNDYFGMTVRDFDGYRDPATNKRLHYYNDTGRNDIYDAKVARDYENIYFMVRTVDDLTPYTDTDWMRLYINVDDEYKGWESYDFVLNKQNPTATEATLEKFTGNGYATEVVGTVSYSVQGNVLMVCIPKTMLGIPADTYSFSFDFKWVDNANEDEAGDIMLWYSNGDVAPIGRFNYCYTTEGSQPHDGSDPVLGWEVLDLTDAENQAILKESLVGNKAQGFDVSFGEDGMTITSTAAASQAELILDYTLSNPRLVADHFEYITITYKTTDLSTIRLGFGAGEKIVVSTPSRAKNLSLENDGEIHTVTYNIGSSRGWENYIHQLGLYLPDGAAKGSSITILSIEMCETNPNPEAE